MATVLENRIRAERLTGRIGAEISGIDLKQTLSGDQVEEVMALLVEHKVLFFRDQHLDRTRHISLARQFGELEIHPLTVADGAFSTDSGLHPEVIVIESNADKRPVADIWHTDVSWRARPSVGSLLRCLVAPPAGGDTLWADMEAIYEELDEATKQLLQGLTATHDWDGFRRHMLSFPGNEARVEQLNREYPPQSHPMVRTHPVSGRKSLYISPPFMVRVNELPQEEGDALVARLRELPFRPEYHVRFRWRAGSLAFWDNRSTQHYVANDSHPHHRLMERVTLAGTERPF